MFRDQKTLGVSEKIDPKKSKIPHRQAETVRKVQNTTHGTVGGIHQSSGC